MTRRNLLGLLSLLGLQSHAGAVGADSAPAAAPDPKGWKLEPAQWRQRLTREQYAVLREEGTEPPFSSALNKEKRAGTYHCAGCQLALFDAAAKYDSGTGWPSFHTALPGAVATRTDFKLILPRTEYHCVHSAPAFDAELSS